MKTWTLLWLAALLVLQRQIDAGTPDEESGNTLTVEDGPDSNNKVDSKAQSEKLVPDPNNQKPRERREPSEFVKIFDPKKIAEYSVEIKRHVVIACPESKIESVRATTLEAADEILNPPKIDINKQREIEKQEDGKKWKSAGGGKVLFLIVNVNDEANAMLLHKLAVSKKIKKPILRGVQFPRNKDMEVFKPIGRYKFSGPAISNLVQGLRMRTLKRVLTSEEGAVVSDTVSKRLTGKTLRAVVNNPTKDVILYLYHGEEQGKPFMPRYEQMAKKSAERETGVVFAHIDVSKNGQDVIDAEISEYPFVAFFKAHRKPGEKAPALGRLDEEDELAYFIDTSRWFKDQPKLTPFNSGIKIFKEEVVKINAKDFSDFASAHSQFLTLFYTDTSIKSMAFRKEFGRAFRMLKGAMPFGKVNCVEVATVKNPSNGQPTKVEINRKLCELHDIVGVPTVMYHDMRFYNGDVSTYNSTWTPLKYEELSVEGLTNYVQAKMIKTDL